MSNLPALNTGEERKSQNKTIKQKKALPLQPLNMKKYVTFSSVYKYVALFLQYKLSLIFWYI